MTIIIVLFATIYELKTNKAARPSANTSPAASRLHNTTAHKVVIEKDLELNQIQQAVSNKSSVHEKMEGAQKVANSNKNESKNGKSRYT